MNIKPKQLFAGIMLSLGILLIAGAVIISIKPETAQATLSSGSLSSWCSNKSKAFVLGDSTSTGYGTTGYIGGNGSPYMATTNGWWATLTNQFPATQWTNLARNGALVSDFLPAGAGTEGRTSPLAGDTIAHIQASQPTLVVIMLGGNEYGTDRRPEQVYKANLAELTSRIRSVAPQASLLLVHSWEFDYRWATGPYLPIEYSWAQYGAAMESIVNTIAGGNAKYLDLTKVMPKADNDTAGLYIADEYGPGNPVHMTNAGNWAMRAAIQGVVDCN